MASEDKTAKSNHSNTPFKTVYEALAPILAESQTWLLDRCRVTTDKASGIVNDPNECSDDPRYIVDLVKRVVRVSLETNEIVNTLPSLNEKLQPANWPFAWRVSE